MIHMIVPERVRKAAKAMAAPLEKKYVKRSNSILSGAGHYYAKIGEIMVSEWFGWQHVDTYNNDILTNGNRRVEVKVKHRTVAPQMSFLATVAAANTVQECDDYLFCSTIDDRELYVIGTIPKDEFYWQCMFRRKGTPDPDKPGWEFRADCFNMPYSKLNPL